MSTKKIGDILKESWQTSGMSQKEFADKMNMSVRNLQYLFEKNDIHISQLAKASSVLKKDFIKEFLELEEREKGVSYPSEYNQDILLLEEVIEKYLPHQPTQPKNELSVQVNIKGDFTLVTKYFPELMSSFKREAEKYGLHLV